MTRRMQDSVSPANIDPGVDLVAGYLNGHYAWAPADWARFPNAVHVGISVSADFHDGHVLDVENGDATPQEAVGWVQARRAAGADPTVYCGAAQWASVKAAFQNAGVPEPHYWIAHYDGDPTIPAGAIAKQYLGDIAPGIDVSSVVDHWPGVDTIHTAHLQDDEETNMQLPAGDHRSQSFDIPAGATKIRVNCPIDFLTVHGIWQAGDLLPAGTNFDWKWSHETDFRVDRLRPWVIDVVSGATQGSIIYSYDVDHPERAGSLSFR